MISKVEAKGVALASAAELARYCEISLNKASLRLIDLMDRGLFEPRAAKDRQLYALVCLIAQSKISKNSGLTQDWWVVFFEILMTGWVDFQLDTDFNWPPIAVVNEELKRLKKTDPNFISILGE